ncbi:MAG: HIT family protein [Phycisphaerales bacterium]
MHAAFCPLCRTITSASSTAPASVIAAMRETLVVLGDNQGCPGWSVLILRDHVEHLAELSDAGQASVFTEVARVAAAIRAVFPASGVGGGPPRINYECLGNAEPHVHWHVIPRHADDPDPTKPVWGWPADQLRGSMSDQERAALIARLRDAIRSAR